MANDVLQLKPKSFLINFWRFAINSTVGIAGLFDVASKIGLPIQANRFADTMAYYDQGKPSTYLELPFIGSTTQRQVFAAPFDIILTPWRMIGINVVHPAVRIPLKIFSKRKKKHFICDAKDNRYEAQRRSYMKFRREEIKQIMLRG